MKKWAAYGVAFVLLSFCCIVVWADQDLPLTNHRCFYYNYNYANEYGLAGAWANPAPSCGYPASAYFSAVTYQDGCISSKCIQGHDSQNQWTECLCDYITVTDDCVDIPGTTQPFCYSSHHIG
jgi:hypothetical protein